MRSRLALFALVGVGATTVDLGLFALLVGAGWWFVAADVAALAGAATWSWVANASVTFRGRPDARWVRQPLLFGAMAVIAGAVDVALLAGLSALGLPLAAAKVAGLSLAAVVRWSAYRWVLFSRVRRELAVRTERGPAPGDRRLSVVIPAFAEEDRIGGTLAELRAVLERQVPASDLELLVVDDGSPDRTADRARQAGADTVVRLPGNRGKGAAVRAGVLAARGRSVVFTDADLAYPPSTVLAVLDVLEDGWDVAVGSRRHDDTRTLVRAGRVRELGGRVVNAFTRVVLLGRFRDTQCGIKGFRSDVARSVFERCRIDGFAFDVEVFLIAEQDRLSLIEVPVQVSNRASSSVHVVRDTGRLLWDLLRIRRWAGQGRYRPAPVTARPPGGAGIPVARARARVGDGPRQARG